MRFVFLLAGRYLFASRKTHFVNLITGVSFLGVFAGTAALVVVLSVYNGLEDITRSLYSHFNPDLLIRPADGKYFHTDSILPLWKNDPRVSNYSFTLEENALVRCGDREEVAMLKGVDEQYAEVTGVGRQMSYGDYGFVDDFGMRYGVVGQELGAQLQVKLQDVQTGLSVFLPRRGASFDPIRPEKSLASGQLLVAGLFNVQPEINRKYLIVSAEWMRELIQLPAGLAGRVEVKLQPGVDAEEIRADWSRRLGPAFVVADRMRQEEAIFKIFQSEKWWTFALLLLIVLVASLSLVGSLSMLVLEKQKEIGILRQLGASRARIATIFLLSGAGVSVSGALAGVVTGAAVAWLQMRYGWLKLGGETAQFVVESYPVRVAGGDVLVVFFSVVTIGLLCSIYPSVQAGRES